MRNRAPLLLLLALSGAASASCSGGFDVKTATGPSTFFVEVTQVNGKAPPTLDAPLPANRGDKTETWSFNVEARTPDGQLDTTFNGVVRLSTRPGAITKIDADGAVGRNLQLKGGKASGTAELTAIYGPSRLWVEDLGYLPFVSQKAGDKPACSNGKDDNDNKLIDFPADPGCAFADDDSEDGGSYAAGISPPVAYALPTIVDIRGNGPATPYPYEAIEVNAAAPQHLIVTRVASDGFYVTDVSPSQMANGYNSVFAFNFSTPAGMRVCDRVTQLSGTVNDFFGFTELSFPSYQLTFPVDGKDPCEVPPAVVIDSTILNVPASMNKIESSLVSVKGFHIAKNFGPGLISKGVAGINATSCDYNGDGQVDFNDAQEGPCSNNCSADPECSEWTPFSARGSYKLSDANGNMILLSTGTVAGFDPVASKGQTLDSVTGTLRKFSGGSLNWTIETRCPDDLSCSLAGCPPPVAPNHAACVRLRSQDDNDQGTN